MSRGIYLILLLLAIAGLSAGCIPTGLVEEAVQATQAGWTPVPTQTPYPTLTPWPTYTLFPTLTPWPTHTPFPTPTPTLIPTATAEPVLLFAEDFEGTDTCFETGARPGGEVTIEDGALHIVGRNDAEMAWSFCAGKNFSDFVFEADATFVGGTENNGFGLLFRGLRNQAYAFLISTDGFICLSDIDLDGDDSFPLLGCWIYLDEIRSSRMTNRLRVAAVQDQIELYVNDHLVGLVLDSTRYRGTIGLVAFVYEGEETEIAFDNVTITRP